MNEFLLGADLPLTNIIRNTIITCDIVVLWYAILIDTKSTDNSCTSVAFYISELQNKNKYYSSKIALLFFKIFPPLRSYTLLHSFEPILEALLPLCWRYHQNMHSERIDPFFRRRKTLTSHFIFYIRK